MMVRVGRWLLPGLSILSVWLMIVQAAFAAEDIPELKRLFDLDKQHADYVVVVDSSGSMKPLWPAVVRGLDAFIQAVPDGEHLSVIFFDTKATNSRVLPRTLDGSTRLDLSRELQALTPPAGANTDLGLALDKTVSELARPGANQLQFVFFLSDFAHDPAAGSSFAARDPAGPEWQELARRYELGRGERLLQTFALLLPIGKDIGRDLPLVEKVLGQLEAVSLSSSSALEEWFRQQHLLLERDKLRVLVRGDAARGWTAGVEHRNGENFLVIESHTKKLSLAATVDSLQVQGLDSRFAPAPVEVPPGEKRAIPFEIFRAGPADPFSRLLVTRLRTLRSLPVEGSVRIELQPRSEVRLLAGGSASGAKAFRVEPESRVPVASGGEVYVLQEGTHPALQAAIVIALLALLLWVWRTWLKPEWTFAGRTARIETYFDGKAAGSASTLPRSKRPIAFVLDPADLAAAVAVSASGDRATQAPPTFKLEFHPRRPRPFLRSPKRGTYCISQSDRPVIHYASRNSERAETVPERLRPGQQPLDPRRTQTFELSFVLGVRNHVVRLDLTTS